MTAAARRAAAAIVLMLTAAAVHAAPAQPPMLVVVIVVDQMRGDYVQRYGFQWTGGLRRLVDGGAWFSRAAYPYLTTVTCVGHATISTGAVPRTHGIVGNAWFDRDLGRSVGCSVDPSLTTISYASPVAGGEGPSRIRAATLSDELRVQLPVPARVVTMSLKERSAIALAGHRADAVTWFNGTAGGFVTSSAYTSAPVPFVAAFTKANPMTADLGTVWTRMLPAGRYLFADAGTGEKPPSYWSAEFPHALKAKRDTPDAQFFEAWEASPFSDDYLGRLAIASVDALRLGQGKGTDFLGISFSALDEVLRALRAVPGVAAAFFAEPLDSHAAAGDRHARAALLSYYPGRSGDFFVMPKPYWFFVAADGTAQPGSATSHGTMYGYDQRVPIILFGKGIKPGEYVRAVTPADIAPTLAYLCGVTLAHADGEVLGEALVPAAQAVQRGR
jgi:hypothetical protein